MNRVICAFHFGSMQKISILYTIWGTELLRPENGCGETTLWKRNGQKWRFLLFLCSFGPKKHLKTTVFLSPLKNDPQQKWCVFKAEKLTAIVFIRYQYLANQQQKTCWKSSYSAF